jgi:acyl-CoA synthetase (AMP-forming)/AMP-acid ligase II
MNTTEFLNIATAICPERNCMVYGGKRWTFAETNERINRLTNALSKLGIRKGDLVGILQVNCPEYIEAYFATAKLGAIFVPLNFRAKSEELIYMIRNAELKLLFFGNRYTEMVEKMRFQLPNLKHSVVLDEPAKDLLYYEDFLGASPPDDYMGEIGDEEVTILMYTAGTTGRPKAVPLRHDAFGTYIMENVDPASPDVEERNLLTVPLYHVAGVQAMLAAFYGGRTLVLLKQFDVKEWMEAVQREKVSRAMLVPTMLKMVIDSPDFSKYDLSSLKVITYGAAPMPFEVIRKAIGVLAWVKFINAYGQTETASTIAMLGPDDHVITGTETEREKKLKRLASSIGRPLPDVEVKIADDGGKSLPALAMGEIWVKGPRVMSGYWGDRERTAQVITPDGWLRTGDKGWLDEDGYIFLGGRGDDMIIRGGENISPEEIENVLYSHPKIEEAAVIGVPDPEWGQQPRAIVVLRKGEVATAEEIIEYCRSKLAGFKRPRSVVFIEALPRNQVGKVIKRALREEYGRA